MKKTKPVLAWAILMDGDFFMSNFSGQDRFWARIMRTKKQAKSFYPKCEVVRVQITEVVRRER